MSLSLEVKKFINSESMGEFVSIMLPGELPTDNAEIRAMNRERAAAEKAAKEAAEAPESPESPEQEDDAE